MVKWLLSHWDFHVQPSLRISSSSSTEGLRSTCSTVGLQQQDHSGGLTCQLREALTTNMTGRTFPAVRSLDFSRDSRTVASAFLALNKIKTAGTLSPCIHVSSCCRWPDGGGVWVGWGGSSVLVPVLGTLCRHFTVASGGST